MARAATICLNMIVKNERHVIERCLKSAAPLIDYWVIVDTGSDDGTQDLIRSAMKGTPGELHERPWKNFGHNRTEALRLAHSKADYLLSIDADEILTVDEGFRWGTLGADSYLIEKNRYSNVYRVKNLVKNDPSWAWHGVLHEYLYSADEKRCEHLNGIRINSPSEGARAHDPMTYRRDALILEQGLVDEPDNTRYMFYLAQSYRDAQEYERAEQAYRARFEREGWEEELYICLLNIARIQTWKGAKLKDIVAAYLKAYSFRPKRAESLFDLGQVFSNIGDWPNARLFLQQAAALPRDPDDILFVEEDIYLWRARLLLAVSAYHCGDAAEGGRLKHSMMLDGRLSDQTKAEIEAALPPPHGDANSL